MKLLTIKDNSQTNKEVFSHIGNVAGKIVDKTLGQLEREEGFVQSAILAIGIICRCLPVCFVSRPGLATYILIR